MRISDVEVVSPVAQLLDRDGPRYVGLRALKTLSATPPFDALPEVLEANRASHRVGLLALWHAVLIEPNLSCRRPFLEEEKVSSDARVRTKHAVREPDDRVQIAFLHEVL